MDKIQKDDLTEKMNKAIAVLHQDCAGLRTGRASVNLLDPVLVDAYGNKTPLRQLGTISIADATTLSVHVWDKSMVKSVEKAISDANLGLTPRTEGQLIHMNLPTLSQERRKELVKIAAKYVENAKVSLRNIRKDGMDTIKNMKKNTLISEDDYRKYSDEIQKLLDQFVEQVNQISKTKENEILNI